MVKKAQPPNQFHRLDHVHREHRASSPECSTFRTPKLHPSQVLNLNCSVVPRLPQSTIVRPLKNQARQRPWSKLVYPKVCPLFGLPVSSVRSRGASLQFYHEKRYCSLSVIVPVQLQGAAHASREVFCSPHLSNRLGPGRARADKLRLARLGEPVGWFRTSVAPSKKRQLNRFAIIGPVEPGSDKSHRAACVFHQFTRAKM